MNDNLFRNWLKFWDTEDCKSFEDCTNCKFDEKCCDFQKFVKNNHLTKLK